MRVLLVEEDLIAARGITLMLKAAGAVVDQTDSGEDALELLRHYEYDVVLLDLALPDIEGFEVVRRMRLAQHRISRRMHTPRQGSRHPRIGAFKEMSQRNKHRQHTRTRSPSIHRSEQWNLLPPQTSLSIY